MQRTIQGTFHQTFAFKRFSGSREEKFKNIFSIGSYVGTLLRNSSHLGNKNHTVKDHPGKIFTTLRFCLLQRFQRKWLKWEKLNNTNDNDEKIWLQYLTWTSIRTKLNKTDKLRKCVTNISSRICELNKTAIANNGWIYISNRYFLFNIKHILKVALF